jgi:hypothetical protein
MGRAFKKQRNKRWQHHSGRYASRRHALGGMHADTRRKVVFDPKLSEAWDLSLMQQML